MTASDDEKACDEAGDVTRAMNAGLTDAEQGDVDGIVAVIEGASDELTALAAGAGDDLEATLLELAEAYDGLADDARAQDPEAIGDAQQVVADSTRALADACGGVAREE